MSSYNGEMADKQILQNPGDPVSSAAKRNRFIRVADWNATSAGLGGFAPDGVHLSTGSAINALADFVHAQVAKAARQLAAS